MANTRKDNPYKQIPVEVKVPNKIRKRIAMHEKEDAGVSFIERLMPPRTAAMKKKRGSMWSRFKDRLNTIIKQG